MKPILIAFAAAALAASTPLTAETEADQAQSDALRKIQENKREGLNEVLENRREAMRQVDEGRREAERAYMRDSDEKDEGSAQADDKEKSKPPEYVKVEKRKLLEMKKELNQLRKENKVLKDALAKYQKTGDQ